MTKDYRVLTSWPRHRKTRKLIRLLGFEGPFRLHCLWSYATEFRPDGRLTGLSHQDIADEAGWEGDAEVFHSALVECGWIDLENDPPISVLHGWSEHNAYATHGPERSERARELAIIRWDKKRGKQRNNAKRMRNAKRSASDAHSGPHAQRNAPVPDPVPVPDPDPDPDPSPSFPPTPPPDATGEFHPRKRQGTAGEGFRSLSETGNGTAGNSEFSAGLSSLIRCDKALKSVCATLEARGAGTLRDELMQQVLPRGIDAATNEPRLAVPPDLHARISAFVTAQADLTGLTRLWAMFQPDQAEAAK